MKLELVIYCDLLKELQLMCKGDGYLISYGDNREYCWIEYENNLQIEIDLLMIINDYEV